MHFIYFCRLLDHGGPGCVQMDPPWQINMSHQQNRTRDLAWGYPIAKPTFNGFGPSWLAGPNLNVIYIYIYIYPFFGQPSCSPIHHFLLKWEFPRLNRAAPNWEGPTVVNRDSHPADPPVIWVWDCLFSRFSIKHYPTFRIKFQSV